ncbi:MAG: Sulfide dehydrogenase flavocytochrome C [uncultured Sulfurovum sp.]|uniref:Sulfide dehydrogenase flavocytochrome C n=1 Tax=uncultured Sulfurovum sp. TaxID=269237 RepID=A0A6S6SG39_9BACT|nr:MAG: Sulfide dehydrogenase flavocytochrome C [uncultured Sulfurovum sp.]
MNRRNMIKTSVATFMALTTASFAEGESKEKKTKTKKSDNPRVVVVGGGWSGLSMAKSVKSFVPNAEVTLVEKRDHFFSCPVSNPWLFDMVDTEFMVHSFIDAAKTHDYTFLQATATGLDQKKNILNTTEGDLNYDYLVFATGIEYDYDVWTHGDKKLENELRSTYPAGFIGGSEHLTLKRKIKNFKGGNFIITVPSGNYRCLPAPYERAALLADHFKRNKIDGKVYLLDANNSITIKEEGFASAFKKLHKDHLVHLSDAQILEFDLEKKEVETDFDTIKFEDASFYPNVKAPKLLEDLGLTIKTAYNRVEANLDVYSNKFKGTKNIYGCGDIRPMGFSKSGNTAYTEGANVARVIANEIYGKKSTWASPTTVCISILSKDPIHEISLVSEYKYGSKGETQFNSTFTDEKWETNGLGAQKTQYAWAQGMFDNMFYA